MGEGAPHADAASCVEQWARLREANPLVQCITNFVSMDLMANCLLAAGASPAMVHGEDEVEEFAQVASALLVNVGTLTKDWVRAMRLAARAATDAGKPWVLDPVGAGATKFRTEAILQLLELRPTLVRGNASEILALAGHAANTRGVDAADSSESALDAARQLATAYETIVAISGAQDYVTDGTHTLQTSNGVELLTRITAAGCSVTALAAAFVSVAPRTPAGVMQAAAHALGVFGVAGQLAQQTACGPGSLRANLLDQLFKLGHDSEPLEALLTIEPLP